MCGYAILFFNQCHLISACSSSTKSVCDCFDLSIYAVEKEKKKEVDSRDGGGATFAVWLLQCLDECQNKNKWLHEAYMLLKHPEWLINNNDSPVKSLL